MTMNEARVRSCSSSLILPRDDIDRLYGARKEGRGCISIEDCVNTIKGLKEYTKKCKERLITAASNCNINRNNLRTKKKTTINLVEKSDSLRIVRATKIFL